MVEYTFESCDMYIGIRVDDVLHIVSGNEKIGYCGISKTDNPKELYLEYVELYEKFTGRHLFRSVLAALAERYGVDVFVFESNEDNKPIYEHFGAVETGYDDFREMWSYRLPIVNLQEE